MPIAKGPVLIARHPVVSYRGYDPDVTALLKTRGFPTN
jgi:hypothetical protein